MEALYHVDFYYIIQNYYYCIIQIQEFSKFWAKNRRPFSSIYLPSIFLVKRIKIVYTVTLLTAK